MADPKFQSFFDKIKNHQGAVDAMLKVGEVMKTKGGLTSFFECFRPSIEVERWELRDETI